MTGAGAGGGGGQEKAPICSAPAGGRTQPALAQGKGGSAPLLLQASTKKHPPQRVLCCAQVRIKLSRARPNILSRGTIRAVKEASTEPSTS